MLREIKLIKILETLKHHIEIPYHQKHYPLLFVIHIHDFYQQIHWSNDQNTNFLEENKKKNH